MKRLYYKLVWLRRGVSLGIFLTWKCNFKCSYCPVPVNKKNKELTLEEWFNFIITFPIKIKQIVLSGGEPTILKHFDKFVNKLLDAGYFVTINTNFSKPNILNKIKHSYKLLIMSNYHSEFMDKETYLNNINLTKHQKLIGEFKELSNISNDFRSINLINKQDFKKEFDIIYKNNFKIKPNGEICRTCYEAIINKKIIPCF